MEHKRSNNEAYDLSMLSSLDQALMDYRAAVNNILCEINETNITEHIAMLSEVLFNHQESQKYLLSLISNTQWADQVVSSYGVKLSGRSRGCASLITVCLGAPEEMFCNNNGAAFEFYKTYLNLKRQKTNQVDMVIKTTVGIGHVKQSLATAFIGNDLSPTDINKSTGLGLKSLRLGAERRNQLKEFCCLCVAPNNHESDTNTGNSSVSESESDSGDDSEEAEVIYLPDQPRNNGPKVRKKRAIPPRKHNRGYNQIFGHRHRKARSNKRSNKLINEFIHEDQNGARIDTDKNANARRVPCPRESGPPEYENECSIF